MSLNTELRTFYEARQQQIPAEVREVMERAARELAATDQAKQAPAVGTAAPAFTLPAADGRSVTLSEALSQGPVVLTFYRGAWCPYCNIALRALQAAHDDITARGAQLIAVTPQIPDESLTLAEKHALSFDILSDVGCQTAKLYGLSFDIPEDLAALYDRFGFEMDRVNAGHPRTLPIPATFVIAPDGTIAWSFVETDYTLRAEPADILSALDRVREGATAAS
jgi:peroxiredoxin